MSKPTYYECGICGHLHNAWFDGDCREDDERFTADNLDNTHGQDGWEEIVMGDIDSWRRTQQCDLEDYEEPWITPCMECGLHPDDCRCPTSQWVDPG